MNLLNKLLKFKKTENSDSESTVESGGKKKLAKYIVIGVVITITLGVFGYSYFYLNTSKADKGRQAQQQFRFKIDDTINKNIGEKPPSLNKEAVPPSFNKEAAPPLVDNKQKEMPSSISGIKMEDNTLKNQNIQEVRSQEQGSVNQRVEVKPAVEVQKVETKPTVRVIEDQVNLQRAKETIKNQIASEILAIQLFTMKEGITDIKIPDNYEEFVKDEAKFQALQNKLKNQSAFIKGKVEIINELMKLYKSLDETMNPIKQFQAANMGEIGFVNRELQNLILGSDAVKDVNFPVPQQQPKEVKKDFKAKVRDLIAVVDEQRVFLKDGDIININDVYDGYTLKSINLAGRTLLFTKESKTKGKKSKKQKVEVVKY